MRKLFQFWGARRVSCRQCLIPVSAEVQTLEERLLPSSTVSRGILRVTGGSGHDTITVNETATTVTVVENGNSRAFQRSAMRQVSITGGSGNDTIVNNTLFKDTIKGGNGNDSITGSDKGSKLFGEAGNDTLFGRGGDDTLDGGAGNDNIDGGIGDDDLFGQAGNDTLTGGLGDDFLVPSSGANIVFSNPDHDLVVGSGTTIRTDPTDPLTGGVDPGPTLPGGGGGSGNTATADDTTGAITISATNSASLALDANGFLTVSLNGGSTQGPFRLPEAPHAVTVTAPNVAIATEVAAALGNRLIVNGVAGSGGGNNGGGGSGGGAGTINITAPTDTDSMTITVTGSANLVIDFLAATDSGPVFRILLNGTVQGEASGYRVGRLTINRAASATVTVDTEISTALGGNLTINLRSF